MKLLLESILKYIAIGSLIINGLLIYQIQILPNKIANAINGDKKDTIVKTVTITPEIQNKSNFIYLKGKIINNPTKKVGDKFAWSPKNPSEFYDGYFYTLETSEGCKYFIWKRTNNPLNNLNIDGWFLSVDNGRWQNKEDYLEVLIPVVERNIQQIN